MSSIKSTPVSLMISDTGNDEIKIFECEKHEEDNADRLSPVIKDEESPMGLIFDRPNNQQQFQYFLPPYYQFNNVIPSFDKVSSLSKFMPLPPPNSTLSINQNTVIPNSIFPLSYSQQPWHSSMFPSGSSNRRESNSQSKKSHIKKPLNAFMLFMKEQRSQVVQECTLRESAAINQILGRKWHELDRNVQQKYYDMARNERLKHMQLYPGWSARDNYGAKKKRTDKEKKRDKAQECLNQKKCRARFGLEQQIHWCKHCKRKKKCLRYAENETTLTWSDEDETDSNDAVDLIPNNNLRISTDSDEENKSRLLR